MIKYPIRDLRQIIPFCPLGSEALPDSGAWVAPGPSTFPRETPHTGRTAQRPRLRALHGAVPAPYPLLPGVM